MKLQFEIEDMPKNLDYPVTAFTVNEAGIRKGPYSMSFDDLVDCLRATATNVSDNDPFKSTSPILPKGTVHYAENRSQTHCRVTLDIPKKEWDIRYGDEPSFYSVGFPRMIVSYELVKSVSSFKVTKVRIFALMEDANPLTGKTQLFKFPFPNVEKETGTVCWGTNVVSVNSVQELERTFTWFVAAPFGEDYGVSINLPYRSFRQLIEENDSKPFEDEWLIPTRFTLEDIL